MLAFHRATDAFYDKLGIGWSYLERERRSLFPLSMNVDYLRKVLAGAAVRVVTRLVDHDHKRIRYFHEMHRADQGYVAATNEILAIQVSMAIRKSEPFPPMWRSASPR